MDGNGLTAPGAFADVVALRECWHPVAFSAALADRPVHADLLGEPLVLWRGPWDPPAYRCGARYPAAAGAPG